MKTPILETERLILRPLSLDDAPAIQKYFNNWNIIQHLSTAVPWPYPNDGSKDFIENICLKEMKKEEALFWVIIEKTGNTEAIGLISYHLKIDNDDTNRGFWLAEPFWNRGYMSEAITSVNDFLFFEVGIERYVVGNNIKNDASRRVKEKTGAKFIRHVEIKHNNGESKSELWEVTRDNWIKARGRSVQ